MGHYRIAINIFIFLTVTISVSMSFSNIAVVAPRTPSAAIRSLLPRTKAATSSSSRRSLSSSSFETPAVVPRAAVAVVVRWRPAVNKSPSSSTTTTTTTTKPRWLLVQRGNEPNRGMWSIPGGKIESGEGTLDAARRELWEETDLSTASSMSSRTCDLKWHEDGPFACSDSIHRPEEGSDGMGFHYVISQCFAEAISASSSMPPDIEASDDAMDARWWSEEEIRKGEEHEGEVTEGVWKVLERSELLYANGLLECNYSTEQ